MIRTNNIIKQQQKAFVHGSTSFPVSIYPKAPFLIFSQGHITSPCSGWHFLDTAASSTFLPLLTVSLFFLPFYSQTILHVIAATGISMQFYFGQSYMCDFGVRNQLFQLTHGLKRSTESQKPLKSTVSSKQ